MATTKRMTMPDGQVVDVGEDAIECRQGQGWTLTDAPPPKPKRQSRQKPKAVEPDPEAEEQLPF